MEINKLQIHSYKIIKIEKGCFMIEYKTTRWSDLKILEKKI